MVENNNIEPSTPEKDSTWYMQGVRAVMDAYDDTEEDARKWMDTVGEAYFRENADKGRSFDAIRPALKGAYTTFLGQEYFPEKYEAGEKVPGVDAGQLYLDWKVTKGITSGSGTGEEKQPAGTGDGTGDGTGNGGAGDGAGDVSVGEGDTWQDFFNNYMTGMDDREDKRWERIQDLIDANKLDASEATDAAKLDLSTGIEGLLDSIGTTRDELLDTIGTSGRDLIRRQDLERQENLGGLRDLLRGEQERTFSENAPDMLEMLESKGLFRSSAVGTALAKERSRLQSITDSQLGKQSLSNLGIKQTQEAGLQSQLTGIETAGLGFEQALGQYGVGGELDLSKLELGTLGSLYGQGVSALSGLTSQGAAAQAGISSNAMQNLYGAETMAQQNLTDLFGGFQESAWAQQIANSYPTQQEDPFASIFTNMLGMGLKFI